MSQTVDRPAPIMSSDTAFVPSLPQTATQRRNARLRAAALQTIPLLLFLFAAALRLWEPDLVPFGVRQAEYVAAAESRSPVGLPAIYADPGVSPLTLVWPILRELPQSVVLWVLLRGLLDSLGVALLFLAARPFVGVWGATLAALLYAVNPWVWAAARDPAGPLTPLLTSAALYGAVRLVMRPTLANGAILGVLLGLLARSFSPGLIVVLLGAVALAIARASWKVGGVTALALLVVGGPLLPGRLTQIGASRVTFGDDSVWAWLAYALTFQEPAGRAAGSMAPPLDATQVVALGLGAWIAGSLVAGWLAWRGQRTIILPSLWALAAGAAVVGVHASNWYAVGADPLAPSANLRAMDAGAPLLLVPILCLMVSVAAGARLPALRWGGTAVAGLLLVVSVGLLAADGRGIQAVSTQERLLGQASEGPVRGNVDPFAGDQAPGWVGQRAHLRDWMALAQAVGEAAARIDADEALAPGAASERLLLEPLQALLGDRVRLRQMTAIAALPLQRETLFIVPASADLARELDRPSSAVAVVRSDGADTGARLLTLRPRPAHDWLAQTHAVADGRFANGAAVLAFAVAPAGEGQTDLLLYCELPAPSERSTVSLILTPVLRDSTREITNPLSNSKRLAPRAGELTVVRVRLKEAPRSTLRADIMTPSLVLRLNDGTGRPVRTASGDDELVIPLTGLP